MDNMEWIAALVDYGVLGAISSSRARSTGSRVGAGSRLTSGLPNAPGACLTHVGSMWPTTLAAPALGEIGMVGKGMHRGGLAP